MFLAISCLLAGYSASLYAQVKTTPKAAATDSGCYFKTCDYFSYTGRTCYDQSNGQALPAGTACTLLVGGEQKNICADTAETICYYDSASIQKCFGTFNAGASSCYFTTLNCSP